MSKAMFGVATLLAVAISPAWAGDEKADEKAAAGETVAVRQIKSESETKTRSKSGTRSVIEPGRDSGAMKESNEVRASFEERWLREREGYRDGGY